MSHRTPPKIGPDWRRVWKAYGVLSTSAAQRKALYARDRGVCSYCGQQAKVWESEHTTALHTIPPSKLEDYPACLWYWTLANLATICLPCHRQKSAKEQTANAKVKRIVKKRTGQHKPKVPFRKPTEAQKAAMKKRAKEMRQKAKDYLAKKHAQKRA